MRRAEHQPTGRIKFRYGRADRRSQAVDAVLQTLREQTVTAENFIQLQEAIAQVGRTSFRIEFTLPQNLNDAGLGTNAVLTVRDSFDQAISLTLTFPTSNRIPVNVKIIKPNTPDVKIFGEMSESHKGLLKPVVIGALSDYLTFKP